MLLLWNSGLSGADGSLNAAVSQESESEAQDFLADDRPNPEQVVIELHDGEVSVALVK
jgi:RNA polymerase sigma-32 factor